MFLDEEKNLGAATILPEEAEAVDQGLLEEMIRAGVLYGRRKSKTNPRMQPYIFTTRNGTEILDIVQTLSFLDRASRFLADVARRKGIILFVGTTPASREFVAAASEEFGYPYVAGRWIGGTLTNFKTIRERIQYYLKLKADREHGKLEKYTKKERLGFDREIERLTQLFHGLEPMTKLPDALVVVGVSSHEATTKEARRFKIPIVGILSSDADPESVNYPVPANDLAKSSVKWILDCFRKAIEEARREPISAPPQDGEKT